MMNVEKNDLFWKRKNLEFFVKELGNSDMFQNILCDLNFLDIIPENVLTSLLVEDTTNTNKARRLIFYIASTSKTDEQNRKIAEVFYSYGLQTVAKQIDPRYTSMLSTRDSNARFNGDLRTVPNILPTSMGIPNQLIPREPHVPLSPRVPDMSDEESSSYASYDNLEIKVIPAKVIFGPNNKKSDVYKNESTPRGYVFLANTSKFDNNDHPERVGSEIDVANLNTLFTQMGYVVEEHINLTKGEMLKALDEFSEDERLNQVDSCIVVVMSHGSHDTGIITADNMTIIEDNIVDKFNNVNCPALRDKPKIFVFQFCRGEMYDVGVDVSQRARNISNINSLLTSNSTDGIAMGETQPIGRTSSRSDIICVYATTKGYVAYLNKDRGSWLIQALCVVFMENAYNTDFEMLLKMVSQKLNSDFASQEGWKQQMERRLTGFDKVFYFNPQPLETLMSTSLSMQELSNALQHEIMTSSSNSNLSITPPHERRHRDLERHSRCSTPELGQYELQHSGSSGLLRSRHSSGTSLGSRDLDPFSPAVRPRHQSGKENRRFSFGSIFPSAGKLLNKDTENESTIIATTDEVDTRCSITGTAEDFKHWRLKNCPVSSEGQPPSLKRQLSAPTETEALKGISKIETFLQVNDLDEHVGALGPIKEAINRIKRQAKKKKRELNSLDY